MEETKFEVRLIATPFVLHTSVFPFYFLYFLFHPSFLLSPRPQKSFHHYLTLGHGHRCHEITWNKTNMKWLRSHTELRWRVFDNPQSILRWKKGDRLGREKRKKICLHFSMNSKILQLPKLEKWL